MLMLKSALVIHKNIITPGLLTLGFILNGPIIYSVIPILHLDLIPLIFLSLS